MNTDQRWKQRFDNSQRALSQLSTAVDLLKSRPLSDFERQGLIQGFEFTHELGWNVLKDFLKMEGIQGIIGSRSTIREAFKRGLVEDGESWMDKIDKRNLSSHTYDEAIVKVVVEAVVQSYLPLFLALKEKLEKFL